MKGMFDEMRLAAFDEATMKELLSARWVSLFSAKLYVSDARAFGCLRVEDEAPVV